MYSAPLKIELALKASLCSNGKWASYNAITTVACWWVGLELSGTLWIYIKTRRLSELLAGKSIWN
jgi:hypothetical protein